MKRLLMCSAVLIAMSASLAHGQTGINLAWNNCITQGTASANKNYACDGSGNGQAFKIVMSFFTPVALPEFLGIQALIDVQTAESTLPDWWNLGVGECREGNILFPGGMNLVGTGSTGACQNPWTGANKGGGAQWLSNSNGDSTVSGMARLKVALARDTPGSLSIDQQYVAGVIELETWKDVDSGDGECSGCSSPVCIVLTQLEILQAPGAPGGSTNVVTESQTRQYVTWQGGPTGGCAIQAPARPMWGSIRAVFK